MDLLYITHFLNGFLMIAMPVALALMLTRMWKFSWRFWLVGAAVFILSQVGHIPFNSLVGSLLNQTGMVAWPKSAQTIFNAIFLGLSAGLFEELSRYAMFRWWLKDARSWRKAVLAGAGHGGAEAIILGVIVLVAFFQLAAYRNMDLSSVVPAAQLELAKAQVAQYWSANWYETLLGALERFFTIPVQITFSVIVLQTFTRKQGYWVWLAVLYHALIDASVVFLAPNLGILVTEALVAGFALISLGLLFALRQPEPVENLHTDSTPVVDVVASVSLNPVEETPENLDNSMYQ
jgi:uncharacterized membrane protein YhfC